jgi:hypothetical protein
MFTEAKKKWKQFILGISMDKVVYNYATVFDYAQGRYEPMAQYRTLPQILTLVEEVVAGNMGETAILVCFSGGDDPEAEFGSVYVIWAAGKKEFRWVHKIYEFKDAFTDAVNFIKKGK